jgi:hypothetical protein
MALSTGGTEQVRVDSAGNVGIGTATPAVKLDAVSSASATPSSAIGMLVGPNSGSMSSGDLTGLGFRMRNSVGGGVDAGLNLGSAIYGVQVSYGTNTGGLASAILLANDCKTEINSHYADFGTGALDSAILLANSLKGTYNVHINDAGGTGEEHIALLAGDGITTADATDLTSLIALTTELLADYDAHDNDAEQAAPVVHVAQEGGDASLGSAVAPINLHECIGKLNDMKTKLNTHMADGTAHSDGDSPAEATADADYVEEHIAEFATIATADATDLATLLALTTAMLTSYDAHDGDSELASAWVYHVAQEAGDVSLASTAAPTTLAEAITRLNDLKTKFNDHAADSTCHPTGGVGIVTEPNAANTAALTVTVAGALTGDKVIWGVLDGGGSSRKGVSAAAGTNQVIFTFSGDPGADAIISYAVFRPAAS